MVAPSKVFEWPIHTFHCSQIPIHQGKTCFQSFLYDLYRFTVSGARYYSPLVLAPILLKRHKIDRTELLEILLSYLKTVCSSACTVATIFAVICLFRNLNGKFTIPTFNLAVFLGGQLCWFFPKRSLQIFTMATTQVALEIVLKRWKNQFTFLLLNSKALQTFCFMISSGIIMHSKRNHQYNGFWFIQPESEQHQHNEGDIEPTTCQSLHTKTNLLLKFVLKNAKTYLSYGISLDLLSSLLKSKLPRKITHVPGFLMQLISKTTLKMTYFFTAYICLYRLAFYYFATLSTKQADLQLTDWQHFAAAAIGGCSYIFVNKLTFNTFGALLAVQVLWQNFCQKPCDEGTKRRNILETLKKVPFRKIVFPFSIATVVSSFFLHNDSVNELGKALILAVTDQKCHRLYDYIIKNSKDEILRNVEATPLMSIF